MNISRLYEEIICIVVLSHACGDIASTPGIVDSPKRIQVPAVGLFPGLDRSLEDNLIPFGVDALSLMIPECFVGIAIAGSGC